VASLEERLWNIGVLQRVRLSSSVQLCSFIFVCLPVSTSGYRENFCNVDAYQ
jgi:hypothetical protein